MTPKCAVELGIPDIIHNHGRAMSLEEPTKALPIHATKTHYVSRFMSLLVHSGFFAIQRDGYVLTRSAHLLLENNPCSSRHLVLGILDYVFTKPWQYMSAWFQNDDSTPFNTAFGEPFWVKAQKEPRVNYFFNGTMASDCFLVGRVVTSKCKEVFEGMKTLVDVGGGTGTMAKRIAEAFPCLECTVFDLPHVVAGLQSTHNLKFMGGSMFESIPSADAIMLKWILHDWPDEECITILKQCKAAITGENRKIIIIEIVMGCQKYDHGCVESQIFSDLEMMTHVSGRERNEKEWAKLFFQVGFSHYKIHPVIGFRALIEVFP